MKIAEEIFQDLVPIPSRLTGYGFAMRSDEDLRGNGNAAFQERETAPAEAVYRTPLMAGAFDLKVTVRIHRPGSEGIVTVKLIDTDTGDDYTQIDNEAYIGAYVGAVRQAVRAVLEDIAETCFYRSGNAWIIPANPRHYDIFKGFADDPDHSLFWTQRLKVAPGDIVFVYHTEPIASLACRCEVVAADIPTDDGNGFTEGKHLMLLRLIERYPPGMYPRAFLNAHGINKTVRGQRSAPPELVLAGLGL